MAANAEEPADKTSRENLEMVQRLALEAAGIRQLSFKRTPVAKTIGKEELAEILRRQYEQFGVGPDYFQKAAKAMKALGFDPDGKLMADNFFEQIIELMKSQVAGLYDPIAETLFIVGEAPPSEKDDPKTRRLTPEKAMQDLQNKMLESAGTSMEEFTLFHEIGHALQDQQFDLETLLKTAADRDDAMLAATSLVEGDAMFLADMRMTGLMGMPADMADGLDFFYETDMLDQILALLPGEQFRELEAWPAIIRIQMLFPYAGGSIFVRKAYKKGGWEAVNEAFRNPPVSTEQILHPEKYLAEPPDMPIPVAMPPANALEPFGFRMVEDNNLGELTLRVLLEEWHAQHAEEKKGDVGAEVPSGKKEASRMERDESESGKTPSAAEETEKTPLFRAVGWGGDRYQVFEGENGRLGYALRTVWDEGEAAAAFREAAAERLSENGESPLSPFQPPADSEMRASNCLERAESPQALLCDAEKNGVVLIEGLGAEAAAGFLAARGWSVEKEPAAHEAPAPTPEDGLATPGW